MKVFVFLTACLFVFAAQVGCSKARTGKPAMKDRAVPVNSIQGSWQLVSNESLVADTDGNVGTTGQNYLTFSDKGLTYVQLAADSTGKPSKTQTESTYEYVNGHLIIQTGEAKHSLTVVKITKDTLIISDNGKTQSYKKIPNSELQKKVTAFDEKIKTADQKSFPERE